MNLTKHCIVLTTLPDWSVLLLSRILSGALCPVVSKCKNNNEVSPQLMDINVVDLFKEENVYYENHMGRGMYMP